MQINDLLKCTGTACVVPDQNNRILIKKYFPFLRITVFLPQAIHNSSRYFVRSVFLYQENIFTSLSIGELINGIPESKAWYKLAVCAHTRMQIIYCDT